MKRTSDVTILGTVVYGVSISTTTFTLRSRTSLGSTQMNNQSKASKSDRYWVMTSEKRSPTYVVYHFDTQRLSPTRVCKKNNFVSSKLPPPSLLLSDELLHSDIYHLLISGVGVNIATDILCESDGCHCKLPVSR